MKSLGGIAGLVILFMTYRLFAYAHQGISFGYPGEVLPKPMRIYCFSCSLLYFHRLLHQVVIEKGSRSNIAKSLQTITCILVPAVLVGLLIYIIFFHSSWTLLVTNSHNFIGCVLGYFHLSKKYSKRMNFRINTILLLFLCLSCQFFGYQHHGVFSNKSTDFKDYFSRSPMIYYSSLWVFVVFVGLYTRELLERYNSAFIRYSISVYIVMGILTFDWLRDTIFYFDFIKRETGIITLACISAISIPPFVLKRRGTKG